MLRRLDLNGDGLLTTDEFSTGVWNLKPMVTGPGGMWLSQGFLVSHIQQLDVYLR